MNLIKKKKIWDSFNLKKKKPLIVMKIDISIKEVIKKLTLKKIKWKKKNTGS